MTTSFETLQLSSSADNEDFNFQFQINSSASSDNVPPSLRSSFFSLFFFHYQSVKNVLRITAN